MKDYTVIHHAARKKLKVSLIEYIIADEIYHLSNNPTGWCYKSKANMAERIGITERQVFNAITSLIKKGVLERDQKTKYLRTSELWYTSVIDNSYEKSSDTMKKVHTDHEKSSCDDHEKSSYKSTNIENTNKNIIDKSIMAPGPKKNSDIDSMFIYWHDTTGIPISSRIKQNRYACSNLLKKHGIDTLKQFIEGVSLTYDDQYSPQIADFTQLQTKLPQLLLWAKKTGTSLVVDKDENINIEAYV